MTDFKRTFNISEVITIIKRKLSDLKNDSDYEFLKIDNEFIILDEIFV